MGHAHSQHTVTRTRLRLLRGKVEVESGLEPVELQVARGEEPGVGGGGGGGLGHEGLLSEGGGGGGGAGRGAEAGLVTRQQTRASLVAGVEGVDERVDSGAVRAGRHAEALHLGGGLLGLELGAVGVEPEVAVCGVVGVDEGVEVGVHGLGVRVVVVDNLGRGGGLLGEGGGGGLDGGGGGAGLGHEGRGVLAVGPGGDVGALEDPEAVLAGAVPHGDGLPVLVDVAVLPDPLPVGRALLPEHGAVLLGEGGAVAAVPGVESLLAQDLGVLGLNGLAGGGGDETRGGDDSEHGDGNFLSLLAAAQVTTMRDWRLRRA